MFYIVMSKFMVYIVFIIKSTELLYANDVKFLFSRNPLKNLFQEVYKYRKGTD